MLISRSTFPPGQFWFFQPQTNWPPINNAQAYFAGKTFDQVVAEIIAHRRANPRHGLSTDPDAVANELDFFTCARLRFDPNYCTGGASGKSRRPLSAEAAGGRKNPAGAVVEAARKYTTGIGVLLDWLGSGAKAVPQAQADGRALTCSKCPKNQPGGIDSYFTQPVAERLHKHAELKNEMTLRTPYDDRLAICAACKCVCSLKVWVPIEHVLKRLKPEMKTELDPGCWITKEETTNA